MLELLSQMVIDESLIKAKQAKYISDIDRTLDNNDKEAFYELTDKYNQFLKQYMLS